LYSRIIDKDLIPLFDYAVTEVRVLRRAGSAFVASHFSYLLECGLEIPSEKDLNFTYMRNAFIASIEEETNPKHSEMFGLSLYYWKQHTQNMPNCNTGGINFIINYAVKNYLTAFKNYHYYSLQSHWTKVCKIRYDISKKKAQMVVRKLYESFDLEVFDNFSNADDEGVTLEVRDEIDEIADAENDRLPFNLKTLEDRIRWHYQLSNELSSLVEDSNGFPMAPICTSGDFPFIDVDKAGLKELLSFAINLGSELFEAKTHLCILDNYCVEKGKNYVIAEDISISDLFNLPHRSPGWELSNTFRTDGLCCHLIWEKAFKKDIAITEADYHEYQEKLIQYQKTWDNEVELAKKECREPNKHKRLFLDSKAKVEETDKKIYPSKSVDDFNNGKPGMYSMQILSEIQIAPGSPAYAVDPGMIDLFSSCKVPNFNVNADMEPIKGPSISSAEFYNRIRVKTPKNDGLNAQLSACSLKTSNYTLFLQNLSSWSSLTQSVFDNYGTRRLRSKKFKRYQEKQQFYDTIAEKLFPEKDATVIMGNGKIQVTMKGRATCPTAKITRHVAMKRRVIFAHEGYTTKKMFTLPL